MKSRIPIINQYLTVVDKSNISPIDFFQMPTDLQESETRVERADTEHVGRTAAGKETSPSLLQKMAFGMFVFNKI